MLFIFKAVQAVNSSHNPADVSMDVKVWVFDTFFSYWFTAEQKFIFRIQETRREFAF